MKRILAYGVLALGFSFGGLGWDGVAQAQQSSLFGGGSGSRSGSGSSGGVTTIGGSSGSSGRGGSSSGMGGSGSSTGSGGRSTTGGNTSSFGSANGRGGTGRNAAGGINEPQFNEFGSVGSQIGQGGFVGRSDNSGRFVGQSQAGQQQSMSRSNFGGQGGRGGQNGNNQNLNQGNQTQNTRKIRPQMKLGFAVPPMATTAVSNTLAVRLTAAQPSLGSVENVNLKLDDAGVVTLTGRVQSQEAKSLAAAILRLEPGVRKVVNDLEVTP